MAGVQQVNHSLGGKLEAHLHPESHAERHQQQVLAQAVLFLGLLPLHRLEVPGRADLPERHADFHQGYQDDHQALRDPLLGGEEGGALGAPVALELGVHAAVDPVQQAVDVVPGHVHLGVAEEGRARRDQRRDSDLWAKHEHPPQPLSHTHTLTPPPSSVTGVVVVVEEYHRLGVLLLSRLQKQLMCSPHGGGGHRCVCVSFV